MKVKGISGPVVAVLLTVISIALAILAYYAFLPMMSGSGTVTANAALSSNQYVAGKEVATISISLNSKVDKPLTIKYIELTVTMSDGSTASINITHTSTGWSYTSSSTAITSVSVSGSPVITAKGTDSLLITITTDGSVQIASVTGQIMAVDPAGNTHPINIPSVSVATS